MQSRKTIFRMLALVTVLFYVLSIGGINVHTCSHTGTSYVTFLFEGTECSDIHPGHDHECCGAHHDLDASDDCGGNCCTNDPHQLQLTGEDHSDFLKHLLEDVPVLALAPSIPEITWEEAFAVAPVFSDEPDRAGDILSSYCILRV